MSHHNFCVVNFISIRLVYVCVIIHFVCFIDGSCDNIKNIEEQLVVGNNCYASICINFCKSCKEDYHNLLKIHPMNLSGSSKRGVHWHFFKSCNVQLFNFCLMLGWNEEKFKCYEAKKEKASSRWESSPGYVACAASAGVLSSIPDDCMPNSVFNPKYVNSLQYCNIRCDSTGLNH